MTLGQISSSIKNFARDLGEAVVARDDFSSPDDLRNRDYAVLGAAAGAVAGGVIGASTGFGSQASNSIKEVWVTNNISHPEMHGYSHTAVPDYSTECVSRDKDNNCEQYETELDGWWHHYSPNISHRVVGQYDEPTFRSSNTWEPLLGGFLGALGGAVVGLGAGLGLAALQRSLEKSPPAPVPRLKPEAEEALFHRVGGSAIGGAIVGAGVGAFVGHRAGTIELGAQEVHTRQWDIPVTQTETLGYIPPSHYEYNWSGLPIPLGGNGAATIPVNRDVPVYDRNNHPRMTLTENTFETNRYGPVSGTVLGGLIGTGVGFALGVGIGVVDKLIAESDAATGTKRPHDTL